MELTNTKLWTALITPLKKDHSVDYDSLEKIAKEQESAQNGVLVLGSTGEALNLSLKSKKEIINFVCGLNLKVPVMAGIGGHNLEEQIDWLNWLEERPVQAYLMVVPHYAKPGPQGQIHWFKTLMQKTKRPVMLYNVPGRSAKELEIEALLELRDLPNFWAVKEASGDLAKFKEYDKASGDAPVYCGDDALFYKFAQNGSSGLVSVASNAWPEETASYVAACLAQDLDEVELWKSASLSLFEASNPVPVKRLMKINGQIEEDVVMPPLSQKDLSNEENLKAYDRKIKAWNERK